MISVTVINICQSQLLFDHILLMIVIFVADIMGLD